MPNWTEQQHEAIWDRGHSLIVCAGAGSGKTAVLTARIVQLVREGTALENMLIVTFTRAAAAEMRSRIADALREAAAAARGEEKRWLAEQSLSVGRAPISTLHSFCGTLLREHFEALTIDPGFRVGDEQECAVLRESARTEALYACYEAGSEAFRAADECWEETELADMADRLWRFARTQPDPEAFYARALAAMQGTDDEILAGPAFAWLLRDTAGRLQAAAREMAALAARAAGAHPSYEKACQAEAERLAGVAAAADDWRRLSGAAAGMRWEKPRAAGKYDKALTEEVREGRRALKDEAERALEPFADAPEDAAQDVRRMALPLAGLVEFARAYGAAYAEAKKRRGILDYDDLEREALCALSGPESGVREALAARYRYVFVDEYQDSSAVQEAILAAFANLGRQDGLFQVGDVKQSIYRFRHAEPSLFREKAEAYASADNPWAKRIDLNTNFRSRANVLAGVNAVFERIMRRDATEIEYDARERLACGLPAREDDPELELRLILPNEAEEEDEPAAFDGEEEDENPRREALGEEQEALEAAARIRALHGQPMYDAKLGGMRETRWRDFAVLMRSVRGAAARVAEILQGEGIPVFCDVGQAYFEIPEVRQTIAVLQAVDNGARDTALMAALRSPAFGLTDADLAEIRIRGGERIPFHEAARIVSEGGDSLAERVKAALEKMAFWRISARHQGIDRLIERVLADSRLELRAAALPDGAGRLANLHLLESKARDFMRQQGGSLHAFLAYVERLKAGGDNESASAIGEGEDVVRIMSVHKSKGLEFPVVLLLGAGKRVTGKEAASPLVLDAALGAGLFCEDGRLHTRRNTAPRMAIIRKLEQEALAEEVRILYVAMTRARDRLIVIGRPRRGKIRAEWYDEMTRERILAMTSMLDMICPALAAAGAAFDGEEEIDCAGSKWLVCAVSGGDIPVRANDALLARLERMAASPRDPAFERLLYFTPEARPGAQKTSVTAAIRDGKFRQEDAEDAPPLPELRSRPRFMMEKRLTAAEIGTAFHRMACCCDLDALRASADRRAEAARQERDMLQRGVISAAEAQSLPEGMLGALAASPLGARMLASERVEREWAFTWRRRTPEGEQLLQGVIDCCFIEEGRWVLVDYKTDSPRDIPAVLERHRAQLALYQEALEALTGIPVAERLLWLVRAPGAYAV